MTEALVCDTSGVLAALDRADPDHAECAAVLQEHPGPLLLSPLILAELDHLLRSRLGTDVARAFAEDVAAGAYDLAQLTPGDITACLGIDRRYGDLGVGLADASLVVLAARAATRSLLTLDHRHFRVMRPVQGGAFHILPADT